MKKSDIYIAFIAMQAVLLFLALGKLKSDAFYLYAALEIISIFAVVAIAYGNDNPSIKISWILAILLLPLFGLIIYLIFGNGGLSGRRLDRMRRIVKDSLHYEEAHGALTVDLKRDPAEQNGIARKYLKQVRYIQAQTGRPLFSDICSEYLPSGEEKLESLLEALNNAKRFIHLEYFIIEQGIMWDKIEEVLLRKVSQGVEVRIIYDHAGSMNFIDKNWNDRLKKAGIKVGVFHRLTIFADRLSNMRNHRKIVVVDGEVGFTGGINIGDEYINAKKVHGYWKDNAIKVCGDAVASLSIIFLNDWVYSTGEDIDYAKYLPKPVQSGGKGYVQFFEVNPGMHGNTARNVLVNLISNADKYLYITTPYLVLDPEVSTALCIAARGGVDVRIIMPGIPDHKSVYIVSRSYFDELLESGVKIYAYKPGFVHSKTVLADGEAALLGSINLDFRSFFLNYEIGALLLYSETIAQVEKDFIACLERSDIVDKDKHLRRPVYIRFAEMLLRLFAPLM